MTKRRLSGFWNTNSSVDKAYDSDSEYPGSIPDSSKLSKSYILIIHYLCLKIFFMFGLKIFIATLLPFLRMPLWT